MAKRSKFPVFTAMSLVVLIPGCGGGDDDNNDNTTVQGATRGMITGFGSVIVNGIEFETDQAEFEIDDQVSTQDNLAVGQVVTVRGEYDDEGNGRATRVAYDADLEGPVSAIDPITNQLTVLGQTVVVNADTMFESVTGLTGLVLGDVVEVSGFRDSAGVLTATFVERAEAPDAENEVTGLISGLDTITQTFMINGLTVDFNGALLDPSGLILANDQLVEVEGLFSGSIFVANKVELEEGSAEDSEGEVEIEATIDTILSDTAFVVQGVTVRHNVNTLFEDGTVFDLAVGLKVEVEGELQPDGSVIAQKVEFGGEDEDDDSGEDADEVKVEGLIEALPTASTFVVLGITILRDTDTVFENGTAQTLAIGVRVEVEGEQQPDGSVLAEEIEFHEDEGDDNADDGDN